MGILWETEVVLKKHLSSGSWTDPLLWRATAHLFNAGSEILTSVHHGDKFSSENWRVSMAKLRFPQRYLCSQKQVVNRRINSLSGHLSSSTKIIIILPIGTNLAFTNAKETQSLLRQECHPKPPYSLFSNFVIPQLAQRAIFCLVSKQK